MSPTSLATAVSADDVAAFRNAVLELATAVSMIGRSTHLRSEQSVAALERLHRAVDAYRVTRRRLHPDTLMAMVDLRCELKLWPAWLSRDEVMIVSMLEQGIIGPRIDEVVVAGSVAGRMMSPIATMCSTSQDLPAQPGAPDAVHNSQRDATLQGVTKTAHAIMLKQRLPDLRDKEIARRVGCHPSTLAKSAEYRAARDAIHLESAMRLNRSRRHRGHDMDAYSDEEGE